MVDPSENESPHSRGVSSQTGSQSSSSKTSTSDVDNSSPGHHVSSAAAVSSSRNSSSDLLQIAFRNARSNQSKDQSLTTTSTTQNSSSSETISQSSHNPPRNSHVQQASDAPMLSHESSGQPSAPGSTDSVSTNTTGKQSPSTSSTTSQNSEIVTGPSSRTSTTGIGPTINATYDQSPRVIAASHQPSETSVQPSMPDVDEPGSYKSEIFAKTTASPHVSNVHPVEVSPLAATSSGKSEKKFANRPVKEKLDEHRKPEQEIVETPRSIRERILNFERTENSEPIPNRPLQLGGKGRASPVKHLVGETKSSSTIPQNDSIVESPSHTSQERKGKDSGASPTADDLQDASLLENTENQNIPNKLPSESLEPVIKVPPPLSLPNRSLSTDRQEEYVGYIPKTTADFIVQSAEKVSQEESDFSNLIPVAPIPMDSQTRCPIAIPAIVVFVLIGIILIPFAVTPGICRLGVCEKTDRSSLSSSKYLFQTFEFSAPLGFLLIPTSIQLFCFAFLFILFRLIVKGSAPEPPLATMAAHIRYTVFKLFYCVVTATIIISFPVFILSGFSSSWTTAFAFIFGLVPTLVSPYIALFATTRVTNQMAANSSELIFDEYTHAARAAAVVPLTSLSLTLFSLILCYNAVRDVRALVGFVLGTALPTLLMRVSMAIFANFPRPSKSSRFHPDDVRHPAAPLPSAAAYLTCIAGNAAQLCATFATPIVATAVLASSLPYFERNPLAMCVQNHLDIDHKCVAYSALKVKFSFAIGLCRLREFYDEYPSLTDRESVSALIAIPFVLAVTASTLALGVAVSTLRTLKDPRGHVNLHETETRSPTRRRLIPFLGPFLKETFIGFLVILLVTGLLVLLHVGPLSPFYHANKEEVDRYVLPETLSASSRCIPRDSPEVGLVSTEFPRLEIEAGRYGPINWLGKKLPAASGIAWRVFVCVILGVLSGILIGIISGMASSSSHRGARRAAAVADDGLGNDVTAGVGVGVVVGAMAATVISLLTLICHHLFGGFGVGICAVGMTYAIGMVGVTDVIALITKESLRLSAMCGASEETLRGKRLLCAVGECIQGCGRTVCTSVSVLGTIALLWVLIQNTGIVPSPREVIDDENSVFTRHITDVNRVNFSDRGILPAAIFGLILPFILCAVLILFASRVSNVIGRAVRNEMLKRGPWERGEYGDYRRCVRVNLRVALVDSVVVCSIAIIGTAVGALWFGRRGWIAMAIGAIASGNILSLCAVVAGTRMEGTRLFRLKLEPKNESDARRERLDSHEWTWEEVGAEWVSGCVTSLLLFVTSSGAVAVRGIPLEGSLWWVGFIVMGAWILSLMAASAIVRYVEKEADYLPDDVTGEDQYDVRVNRDVRSPFFEEAPRMDRNTMNRSSVLRHVETGSPSNLDPLSA